MINKQSIQKFFRPTRLKIILFFVFLLIAIAGQSEAWIFSDGEEFGIPKPWLYNILEKTHIPFWSLWMYLILPLFPLLALSGIFQSIFGHALPSQTFLILFWVIQIIYFYLLACFITFIAKLK